MSDSLLKSILPRRIRKKLYRFARRLYIEDRFPSIEASLDALKQWGFKPDHIIDIGAYHGIWTRMVKARFPDAKVLMIEAQESKREILEQVCDDFQGQVVYESALLGPEDGKQVNFTEMETGSSVFQENSPYAREQVTREQRALDQLITQHAEFTNTDLLKLDVQGYELEVLKGADKLLRNSEIVLLEASFIPVNQGAPLIHEVIAYMVERDFRLLDFCSQVRRKDNALWQTDLLFIRNDSSLIPPAALDEANWRRIKK